MKWTDKVRNLAEDILSQAYLLNSRPIIGNSFELERDALIALINKHIYPSSANRWRCECGYVNSVKRIYCWNCEKGVSK